MMKKFFCVLLAVTLLLFPVPITQAANTEGSYISAAGAYVMDYETGTELYSYNGDQVRVPASMTKIMSMYIIYEALANGEITLNTRVPISERVYNLSRNASYINMVPLYYNQVYTVNELIDIIIVYSASASVVAMAELISGSEDKFIERMNKKVGEMGLEAWFECSCGVRDNKMSPKSMAILARNIIRDYPDILKRSSKASVYFHGSTYKSTNLLLGSRYYEGADGLKTGTTGAAGYCLCGTAMRNGVRIITVVMASSSTSQRYTDTHQLLNYGFAVRNEVVASKQVSAPSPAMNPNSTANPNTAASPNLTANSKSTTNPNPAANTIQAPNPNLIPDTEPEYTGPFIDTSTDAWYYDSVMLMWENGIMSGTSANTFGPNDPLTRAMAATVIYRAAREPELDFVQVFKDVPDGLWYSKPTLWASAAKIMEGNEDGTFGANEFVTREEFITMLYRFVAVAGYDVSSAKADLSVYSDADDISDWAVDAMSCAVAMKLINGTPDKTLEPGAYLTRAQCAAVLKQAAVSTQA